jgi:diadenosine tetraphosphate (Ap4A) HIT family hydrolase
MCELCDLNNSDRVVGGDDLVNVVVPKTTTATAYVIPKQHAPLGELSAQTQQRILITANMLSSAIFDGMQVHGTNIIIQDEEHSHALVLGRTEEDGVDLRWQPNRATQQELQDVAKKISEETWYIGKAKDEAPKSYIENKPAQGHKIQVKHDPVVPGQSSKSRIGYDDPDSTVDTPDEIARDIQTKIKKEPRKDNNYQVKHLTRRR